MEKQILIPLPVGAEISPFSIVKLCLVNKCHNQLLVVESILSYLPSTIKISNANLASLKNMYIVHNFQ